MDKTLEEELAELEAEALAELEELNNDSSEDESEQTEEEEGNDNSEPETNDDNTNLNQESENTESTEEEEEDDDNDNTDSNTFDEIDVEVAGQPIKIKSREELVALLKDGLKNYGKDEKEPTDEQLLIEQNQVTSDDLKLLIDAKNGDPLALAKLAKISNVHDADIDVTKADEYKPNVEVSKLSEIEKAATEVMKDVDVSTQFKSYMDNLPEDFKVAISGNAEHIRSFAKHIKDGKAAQIIPEAIKHKAINGGTFFDAYAQVGYDMFGQKNTEQKQKPVEQKRQVTEKERKLREKARLGNTEYSKQSGSASDVWDMSEEDFQNLDLKSLK